MRLSIQNASGGSNCHVVMQCKY